MGKLFVVPTPVGNLEDMTFRAIRTLKEVDLILAEDTRTSSVLLKHFEIKKPMLSHHKFNEHKTVENIVNRLKGGENVALISDAGTPGISDPGEELVKMCYEAGIEVTSLPGAAACITALTLSGLSTRRFAFEAFLPSEKKDKQAILREMQNETRTIVMYEAPHRLVKTLQELLDNLGNRRITVCRELTKKHEVAFATTIEEAVRHFELNEPKGECVLVMEGKSHDELRREEISKWEEMSIEDHMEYYMAQGIDRKEAMKSVAKDRGIGKRDVYQQLL